MDRTGSVTLHIIVQNVHSTQVQSAEIAKKPGQKAGLSRSLTNTAFQGLIQQFRPTCRRPKRRQAG